MKIRNVVAEIYTRSQGKIAFRHDFPLSKGEIPFTVVRVIADDGTEGYAFGSPDIAEPIINNIKPEIIGQDILAREWIWQRLWYLYDYGRHRPFPLGAISAVDIALWDIAGKALGVPVYKLMGAYRDKIKIYASSWGKPSTQDYVDEVTTLKRQGITAYKIHPYWRIGEKDVEVCRAVRQAAGSDMKLMLDPAGHYSRQEAFWVGKELEKLDFYWFEEPIPDYDIEGLNWLREKLNVPICTTETSPMSMFSIPEYILRRAADIIRCDTWLTGGITPTKKVADLGNAFGVQCEIHASWFPTCSVANLHVECAIKNCEFYEFLWPEWRYGLKGYPEPDAEGYLHVPQEPGLGIEIDWETLGNPIAKF